MIQDRTFKGKDGNFHYIEWGGEGPLAHLAHGTGFNARLYTPLVERLRPRLNMVGLDLRGHGLSTAPADPDSLKSWHVFGHDLEAFFEYLGRPVVAVGHSMGAVVSMMVAARRPDLVRAMILLDPTVFSPVESAGMHLLKRAGLGGKIPLASGALHRRNGWPDRETVLKAYGGKSVFRTWQDGFLENYLADGVRANGSGTVGLTCDPLWESRVYATVTHETWSYIRRLEIPLLVVYGCESNVFRAAAVRRFRRVVPEAVFVGYQGAGHFVPMERPEEIAGDIASFLESLNLGRDCGASRPAPGRMAV